jgi:curved DNA-binding protein CbpA
MTWNPYEELGLEPNARKPAIRAAYRKRCMETHPDTGGSEEAFAKVALAYAILTNSGKRKKFDDTGVAEEPEPDQTRPAALGLIAEALNQLVQQFQQSGFHPSKDPEKIDVLRVVAAGIQDELGKSRKACSDLERCVKTAHGMVERLKRKHKGDGEDPLARALQTSAARAEESIANNRKAIKIREAALALLKEYNYSFEQVMMINAGPTTTFAWSTT